MTWAWWTRAVARFRRQRNPEPQTRRPSAVAEAHAAGWSRESAGYWSHPALGVVEREARTGRWRAQTQTYDAGRFATMREAMKYAESYARPPLTETGD